MTKRAKDPYRSYRDELQKLEGDGLLRTLTRRSARDGSRIICDGRSFLNLCSNDYLGVATAGALLREFYAGLNGDTVRGAYALGNAASRLMTGTSADALALEADLARWYGREALVFNSGYHGNVGMLAALCGAGDVIVSDKLNHASIIDGMRLSGARFLRYRHRDYDHCERLLHKARPAARRVFLVSESMFSMDGDEADVAALVRLKRRYDALLYIDEAHAVGVRGPDGRGVCAEQEVTDDVDVLLGTFGKALGSIGAYGVMDRTLKRFLINRMRPFIFTTALPPVVLSWNRFILGKLPELQPRRNALAELSRRVHRALREGGLADTGTGHIVPVILGRNEAALDAAQYLRKHGVLALAVRPPTVPPNRARLRLSLTADMTWDELRGVVALLRDRLQGGEA